MEQKNTFKRWRDINKIHCIYMESNTGSAGAIAKAMTYGLTRNSFDYFWVLGR